MKHKLLIIQLLYFNLCQGLFNSKRQGILPLSRFDLYDKRASAYNYYEDPVVERLSGDDVTKDSPYITSDSSSITGKDSPAAQRNSPDLRYDVNLDEADVLHLEWDIDPPGEVITFRLTGRVEQDDLVIFGFSDYGEVNDADLVLIWTDYKGRRHFQDGYTDSSGEIHVDLSQDYILDDARTTLGQLQVTFHRLYDTCDDDDYIIDEGTTHLIFYTTSGPIQNIRGLDFNKANVGLQRVQLIRSQLPDPEFPEDTRSFKMTVHNVTIPDDETTYWCSVQKLPHFKEKHHIIQFEGAISDSSRGIVHHMEVFHCEVAPGESVRPYNAPCKTMGAERPKGLESCRKVIGAWAMGAKPLTYPEEAGSPIGGLEVSRYIMMEVHYNNPQHHSGVIDSSGIRFYVTSELRQYDAGIMELGLEYTDKMALPPGLPRWDLVGYCTPKCTDVALPKGGIKVFASQLHTHLTGRRTYTKHYRNGIELPELNRDNHYSPHYQEIRKLKRQVHVLPGDALIHTCEDSTVDKNLTLGGFSISDEMCVNYIHYYPAVNLEVCKSSVTTDSLYEFFSFLNYYQGEATSPDLGISDNYKSIRWTPMNTRLLRSYYDHAPISMQCNQSNGEHFPGNWEGNAIPDIRLPLPPQERLCLQ